MEQNFQDIYEQLQSRIRQAEDKRLQLKAKGTKNGLIAGGITLVAGVVVSLIIGGGWPGILIACMLGLIVLFSCIQSKSGELCAYYKENIISSIISYLCQEASYRPESGIAESVFMNSRLFSTSPDRYRSEDLFYLFGNYSRRKTGHDRFQRPQAGTLDRYFQRFLFYSRLQQKLSGPNGRFP